MKKYKIAVIALLICAVIVGIIFVRLNKINDTVPDSVPEGPTVEIPTAIPTATGTMVVVNLPVKISNLAATSVPIATSTLFDVPFTPQAPSGNWADLRQESGCEEASALMAVSWARGEKLTPEESEKEIIAITDYELAKYGYFEDTSVQDTALRILSGYFGYENYEVRFGIGISDIIAELNNGNIAIVALAGQKLANPFYTPPGPANHMMVVVGYDAGTKEFITNDPGTSHGEKFRYPDYVIERSLRDYPSGKHEAITEKRTAMIVVRKP